MADRLDGFARVAEFAALTDPARFAPVPSDWVLGLTDVVGSSRAIAAGRYKAVNMAGAAAISGMMNAIGSRRFAFAFGGDGCVFVVPGADADVARDVLARTAAWVRDDLRLKLRAALVPVADVRAAGCDVRLALFAPTEHVAYAMFDGGGVALAERWMKAGTASLTPAGTGARPDLTGLSCRWLPIRTRRGAVLSVIVQPGTGCGFREAVDDVLRLAAGSGHPVPPKGPPPAFPARGLGLETAASRGGRPFWRRWPEVLAHALMGYGFFLLGARAGAFDAPRYRRLAGENADVRKMADGLLVTLDASPAVERAVRERLERAAEQGAVRFGLFRQDAALMTCIVPSYQDDGHFHFIDGAGGGYTAAAQDLSARSARADEEGRA